MQRKFSFLPTVVLAIIAIRMLFPDWWGHLNTKVIDGYGDGYKAYHAILYHAKYDSTYSWYEGMNYPYGDHVVPGASQPILSNGLRLLAELGLPLMDQGWAIVHLSMLLGIVLAALFTFLLLRRLGINGWLATLAALLTTFLAPQLARIVGHYGLAHVEVLPATLYFLYRWEEAPGWKRTLPVALCVWFFSQIHFYYFAILAFLIGGYLLARYLLTADWKRWWYYGWTLFLMFGLPALYFTLWFKLSDPIADRNDHPWGFFAYNSSPSGIFTSHTMPFWEAVRERQVYFYPDFEGQAYIGLVFGLFLLFIVGRWLFNSFRFVRQKAGLKAMAHPILPVGGGSQRLFLQSLLFSATGIAIFSFGFPLTLVGGEAWLEHLGPIRQFRSIGRFAWIFYYAVHLCFWVELGSWLQRRLQSNAWKKALAPIFLAFLASAFTLYEIQNYWRAKDFRLDEVDGFNSPTLADRTALDFDRYQAIIPLPYYNIGTDNFWLVQSGFIGQRVQTLSWQTGLSTTAAMLTRTSFSQTLKQLQLITEPYRMPTLLQDLPNQKPFLLAYDAERYHLFGDRSNHLTQAAVLRYQDPPFYLFELPLSSWQDRIALAYQASDSLWQSKVTEADSAAHQQVVYVSFDDTTTPLWAAADSISFWSPVPHYTSSRAGNNVTFTHSQSEDKERGLVQGIVANGYLGRAFQGDLGLENTAVEIKNGLALRPGDYLLSFWMDIGHARYPTTNFELQTLLGADQAGPTFGSSVREWVKVMDTNGWVMVEFPIKISETTTGIRLNLSRPLLNGRIFQVDDVLLRPKEVEVMAKLGQDTLYHNNRYRLFIQD